MALRISMEEQRRVQESEIGRGTGGEGGQQNPPTNTLTSSVGANTLAGDNEIDVTRRTEGEQIALAIQMSMTQAENAQTNDVEMKEEPPASTAATTTQQTSKTTEETQPNTDTFAASLNDPQFLRDVLRDLPGVDVDSDAVRAALEQVHQQQKKDTDDNDDNDKSSATKKKKDEK